MNELITLLQNPRRPNILVIGDIMLDRYIWGNAERISQEAPVILLRADYKEERLGGAGSVASMLQALDVQTHLIGVIGQDEVGERVLKLLEQKGIEATAVLHDPSRPTTLKERYIGRAQTRHPQQMLRVDYEECHPIDTYIEKQLQTYASEQIEKSDIILISDYNKGTCTHELLQHVIRHAHRSSKIVIADPTRGGDYSKYHGCTALTPNRHEAGLATGHRISTIDDAIAAAVKLWQNYNLEASIVTLDKDGIVFAHRDGRTLHFSTRPRQVYDITGAGDMVMASLGMALALKASFETAIQLANIAGGLEVERIGAAPISRTEILSDILQNLHAAHYHSPDKIMTLDALLPILQQRRMRGERIAFTNGCFDILHAGHVRYLAEARQQADCLVVGLNDDASVRLLKGAGRPLNPVHARVTVLAAIQSVDYIVIFDEPTPMKLIQQIKPDVLVKGGDYRKDEIVGADYVESYGGRIHIANYHYGYSSTNIIHRAKAA
ncbi:MAG: D-glycero-beta-D-manno-heptose 1-phosphate adenylyltransferase [Thermogemmata sp.]|nr:D-glycero-beta-D-manno-heptose 1-phosphate adenylyltransferase [Thermogemmata sp.]